MTRHDDRERILRAGSADRAHRPRRTDAARDLGVGPRLAARDLAKSAPHAPLERRPHEIEREVRCHLGALNRLDDAIDEGGLEELVES